MKKLINVHKEILGGTPVFMGTHVAGLLDDFPAVKQEQVQQVLKSSNQLLTSLTEVAHEKFS